MNGKFVTGDRPDPLQTVMESLGIEFSIVSVDLGIADPLPDGSKAAWLIMRTSDHEAELAFLPFPPGLGTGEFSVPKNGVHGPDCKCPFTFNAHPARNIGHGLIFERPDGWQNPGDVGPLACSECSVDWERAKLGMAPR